jgi:hypothetical protein
VKTRLVSCDGGSSLIIRCADKSPRRQGVALALAFARNSNWFGRSVWGFYDVSGKWLGDVRCAREFVVPALRRLAARALSEISL